MADSFIGEVRIVPFNFAPQGWAFCDGQVLPTAQASALFGVLGPNYGGNGNTTFALPNLKGSVVIGSGDGPGLTPRSVGDMGGEADVSLLVSELPLHNHGLRANTTAPADINAPGTQSVLAVATGGTPYEAVADSEMYPTSVGYRGSGLPHNNMQPYLTLNFIISIAGIAS